MRRTLKGLKFWTSSPLSLDRSSGRMRGTLGSFSVTVGMLAMLVAWRLREASTLNEREMGFLTLNGELVERSKRGSLNDIT